MLRVCPPALLWCWLVVGCVDLELPPQLQAIGLADAGPPGAPAGADASYGSTHDLGASVAADALLGNGRPCAADGQCDSGQCVQGRCCDQRCAGPCLTCNLAGKEGTCTPVPAGEDPQSDCPQDPASSCGRDGTCDGRGQCRRYPTGTECEPGGCAGSTESAAGTCDAVGRCMRGASRSCAPNMCKDGSCAAACTVTADCQGGFFCDQGRCALRKAAGATCGQDGQCASGFCVDGVCCGSRCSEVCYACNLAGSPGVCTAVPAGNDPRAACAAEPAAGCGRDGACDGRGSCRLHAAGTMCAPRSCSGVMRRGEGTCNGIGTCASGATSDCSPYTCGGAEAACLTSCSSTAQCAPGNVCQGGQCVKPAPDLALYWKFDEPGGATTASDSSGRGRDGSYTGARGTPAASTSVPPVSFPNPASRAFTRANRHAVVLPGAPSDLRPSGAVTISVWFRATSSDLIGSDVVGLGSDYFLRIKTGEIEWVKRVSPVSPVFAVCQFTSTAHLDGQWHHFAGVNGAGGLKGYLDGTERCTLADTRPIIYEGTDVIVGRNGNDHPDFDFEGNIDDVRIYTRALGAAEVRSLAGGAP